MTQNRHPITRVNVRSQQFAMATLGIYRGAIDGIWGTDSIKAQKEMYRLHGGTGSSGQIMKEPGRLPRHFSWARLDNQEFMLFEDPTGEITTEAYVDAFIEACAPEQLENAHERDQSPGSVRAAAEHKSSELLAARKPENQAKAPAAGPKPDLKKAKDQAKDQGKGAKAPAPATEPKTEDVAKAEAAAPAQESTPAATEAPKTEAGAEAPKTEAPAEPQKGGKNR